MHRIALLVVAGLVLVGTPLDAQSVDLSDPVATAVLPLPADFREDATVVDQTSEKVLRRGRNGFTCLTDVPGNAGLSVQCHPTVIEPYLRRGRELSADQNTAVFDPQTQTASLTRTTLVTHP